MSPNDEQIAIRKKKEEEKKRGKRGEVFGKILNSMCIVCD